MKKLLTLIFGVSLLFTGNVTPLIANETGKEQSVNVNSEEINIFAEYDAEFISTHTFLFDSEGNLTRIVANEDAIFDEDGFFVMTKREAKLKFSKSEWWGTWTYNFGWADNVTAQFVADRVWQSGLSSGQCYQISNFWNQAGSRDNVKATANNGVITSLSAHHNAEQSW